MTFKRVSNVQRCNHLGSFWFTFGMILFDFFKCFRIQPFRISFGIFNFHVLENTWPILSLIFAWGLTKCFGFSELIFDIIEYLKSPAKIDSSFVHFKGF